MQNHGVPLDVIVEEPHKETTNMNRIGSHDSTASEGSSITASQDSPRHSDNNSAQELLEKANARLQLVEYENIISELREEVVRDKKKIGALTLQLKRATASKCDLVVACNDIENQKLNVEQMHYSEYRKWRKAPLQEQEFRAQVEKDFMNELTWLTDRMEILKQRQKFEVLEKDFEIAKLQEKLRRLQEGDEGDAINKYSPN